LPARLVALVPGGEELVIAGLDVTHMRSDGKAHCASVQYFGRSGATDTATVLAARMLRDGALRPGRAARKEFAHALREAIDMVAVEISAPRRLAFALACTGVGVFKALGLGLHKRGVRDKYALPLVPLAGTAPLEHDARQHGVLARAPRQRGVSRRKEHEMIEVRTRQAKSPALTGEGDPRAATERVPALVALRLPGGDENLQAFLVVHRCQAVQAPEPHFARSDPWLNAETRRRAQRSRTCRPARPARYGELSSQSAKWST